MAKIKQGGLFTSQTSSLSNYDQASRPRTARRAPPKLPSNLIEENGEGGKDEVVTFFGFFFCVLIVFLLLGVGFGGGFVDGFCTKTHTHTHTHTLRA